MPAVVLQSEFYSKQDARRWRINLHDTLSTATLECDNDGFEIIYDESDTLLNPIKGSQCVVRFVETTAMAAIFASFKTALSIAAEDEFKLYIEEYVSGAWVIHWAGCVVSDTVEWDNQSSPRYFTVRAIDGLRRLEKIPFDAIFASPYTTAPQTFLKIIFDCLALNGLAQFWNGSSKHYIRCNIDWYDTQQNLTNVQRVLENVRAEAWKMVKKDSDTDKQYADVAINTLEIISGILKLFGARIIMSDGSYYIMQPRSYEAANVTTFSNYNYLGAYVSMSVSEACKVQVYAPNDTAHDLHVLAGGQFGYLPALNKVVAKTEPFEYIVPITTGAGLYLSVPILTYSAIKLGTIRGGNGSLASLRFAFATEWKYYDAPYADSWSVKIRITVRAGTYRIKNRSTGSGYIKWTQVSADYFEYNTRFLDVISGFSTNEIPFPEETNCEVDVSLYIYPAPSATHPIHTKWALHVKGIHVGFLIDNKITTLTEYELINPDTTANSIELGIDDLVIQDTGAISTLDTLEVQTTQTSGTWNQSNVWEAGFTTDSSLVASLVMESMSLQRKPPQKYTGGFIGDYQAWKSVYYDSLYWFLIGARFDANENTWNGAWVTTQQAKTGLTPVLKSLNDPPVKYDPKDPDQGQSSSNLLIRESKGVMSDFLEEGDAVTSLSVEALDNDQIKADDTIQVLSPTTGEVLQELVVESDAAIGATTIAIIADTATSDLPGNALIAHNPKEIVASEIGRFDTLIVAGEAIADSVVEINLTYPQLRSLFTTQIAVLANPTSGYHYEISKIRFKFTAVIPFANVQDIQMRGTTSDLVHWRWFKERFMDNVTLDDADELLTHPIFANEGLELYCPANMTTGTGTLTLFVYYKTVANI